MLNLLMKLKFLSLIILYIKFNILYIILYIIILKKNKLKKNIQENI